MSKKIIAEDCVKSQSNRALARQSERSTAAGLVPLSQLIPQVMKNLAVESLICRLNRATEAGAP